MHQLLTYDGGLRVVQMLFSLVFVFGGMFLVVSEELLEGSVNTGRAFEIDIWGVPSLWVAVFSIATGCVAADWMIIKSIISRLIKRARWKEFFSTILATSFLMVLVYGAVRLVEWLSCAGYSWVVSSIVALLVGLFGLICVCSFYLEGSKFLRDRRVFGRFKFDHNLSRLYIAESLGSLRTDYWRVKYVRKLAILKVEAFGTWPKDFKMPISAELAITELARLEERWLKLDR